LPVEGDIYSRDIYDDCENAKQNHADKK